MQQSKKFMSGRGDDEEGDPQSGIAAEVQRWIGHCHLRLDDRRDEPAAVAAFDQVSFHEFPL